MPSLTAHARPAGPQGLFYVPKLDPGKSDTAEGWGRFPSPELVGMAAATLADASNWGFVARATGTLYEGPRFFVTVSPGSVRVSSHDLARGMRSQERAEKGRRITADLLAAELRDNGAFTEWTPSASIRGWSAKSRANMVRRLVSLDYGPLLAGGSPCMVTLTYPGDWLTVAKDGPTVKRHLDLFARRYAKRFKQAFRFVWKQEYQRRGAPHFHLFTVRPAGVRLGCGKDAVHALDGRCCFRAWVGMVWADIVAAPDPEERARHQLAGTGVDEYEGAKCTDPKRVAVYFAKHGLLAGKEYQNNPPAEWVESGLTVGRFWGYRGISPVEVPVEVAPSDALTVSRTLRKLYAVSAVAERGGNRYTRPVRVWRTNLATGVQSARKVTRPVRRMRGSAGFVSCNDGPSLALVLERAVRADVPGRAERRERFRSANGSAVNAS